MGDDVWDLEPSEVHDQLDGSDTLSDRLTLDPLDEGYATPEKWSAVMRHGATATQMFHGETLEMRIAQEAPDEEIPDPDADWTGGEAGRQVGGKRAGRLIAPGGGLGGAEDTEASAVGQDVGIDGGAATAEEAAMHIIDDESEIDDDFCDSYVRKPAGA